MRPRLILLGALILLSGAGSWVVSTQNLPHRPLAAHKVKGDLDMIEGQGGTSTPTSTATTPAAT